MLDQLARWQTRALQRAHALRLDPQQIVDAPGILCSALGEAWVSEACRRDPGHPIAFRAHPIGNMLVPPGDEGIVALLELVEYLKHAGDSHAFREIAAGLRAQYGPTFLQLAFAYRFTRIGAQRVVFEPEVRDGLRGDIAFDLEGVKVVVECYIPRLKSKTLEVDWLLQQCVELRGGLRANILSIAILLKGSLEARGRKLLVAIVRDMCQQLDQNFASGEGPDALLAENEWGLVSVAMTREAHPGEYSQGRQHPEFPDLKGRQPTVFARVSVAPAKTLGEIDFSVAHRTRDHVAIWLSAADAAAESLEQDLDAPLETLAAKLERKLAQTRSPGAARLLVVSSWMTRQLSRGSASAMQSLRRRLFVKHADVGLLMVSREWKPREQRHRYVIVPVFPEVGGAIGQSLMRAVEAEQQPVPPFVAGSGLADYP